MSDNHVLQMDKIEKDIEIVKEKIDLSDKNLSNIPIELIKNCACLKHLELYGNEINEILEGTFDGLVHLTELRLDYNKLCNIPANAFKDCQALRILNLDNNEINEILEGTFDGLVHLTKIKLDYNKLCTIPANAFKDCKALRLLYLDYNEINEVPKGTFDNLVHLTEIRLDYNKLCTIPEGTFNGLVHLTEIRLDNNKLSTIPANAFKDCQALRILNLSFNFIKEIPEGTFDGLVKLDVIMLDNNKLCTIPANTFKDCKALKSLYFDNNKLCTIPANALKNCKALRTLYINNNELNEIPEKPFDGLVQLTEIGLSNNKLCTIPVGTFNCLEQLTQISLRSNKLSTIPADAFKDCQALTILDLSFNAIKEIPEGTFDGLVQLSIIWLDNNKLCTIPAYALKNCKALRTLYLNNNEINEILEGTFDGLFQLTRLSLQNNKLCTILASSFKDCEALEELYLNNNQINEIIEGTFDSLYQFTRLSLQNNKLCTIPADAFKDCETLNELHINYNEINEILEGTFDGLVHLTELRLDYNKLCNIPANAFKDCQALRILNLDNNEINEILEGTFDGLVHLTEIRLDNNKLSTIPANAFKDCEALKILDLSFNAIKLFKVNSFTNCSSIQDINLDNNFISSISFAALEPLKSCRSLVFSDNLFFNPRILYSFFLKKYLNHYKQKYFILRNNEDGDSAFENKFLLFYLSDRSRVYSSIFGDKDNKLSLKYKLDIFKKGYEIKCHKSSLLDLFIWLFGEIDDSKIIHLKDHIDQLTRTDPQLINNEFLIRSQHSIKNLCKRNVSSHFNSFFPHTYFELTALLQKTQVKERDFQVNEEDYFKGFLDYLDKKEEEPQDFRPIFFDIDYQECFDIAIDNKNCEISKFVILLLRYFFIKLPESPKMKDALNKFNRNLLLKFDMIFRYELYEIVSFLLDIRKLDEFSKPKKNKIQEFLVYDIAQFNAKPQKAKIEIGRTEKKKEFLELLKTRDDLLKHESSKLILQEKWREKSFFTYYFQLFWSLIFVVFYTIYIEVQDQPGVDTNIQLATKYISLILVIVNILVEIFQIVESRSNRQKFIDYMSRATNRLEWIIFVLCVPAIVLGPGDWKSSLCSLTICSSYVILMTRMDKTVLGGYVKVIGKIARDSLQPLVIVIILLLGFLMAFRNRAHHKGSEESSSFETMGLFNSSFEYSFSLVYTMMVGNLQTEDIGITNLTLPNLVNFFIFIVFLFIISTLAFNIFTGIAIDEIKSLIADSNVQIMKDKITYIYENSIFDKIPCNKRLLKLLKYVFRLEDFAINVKEYCLEIICGKSNQVEIEKATASQERKRQEAYDDDRYLERFETLEDRNKKIENKIDRILNLKDQRKRNQVADSVSILPSNDNSLSDDGLKDLFKMIRKISQQQESIDQQMKSQKKSIDEQNRGMIELSNQMKSQKESIDKQNGCMHKLAKQMVKIKNKLKTQKAEMSSED